MHITSLYLNRLIKYQMTPEQWLIKNRKKLFNYCRRNHKSLPKDSMEDIFQVVSLRFISTADLSRPDKQIMYFFIQMVAREVANEYKQFLRKITYTTELNALPADFEIPAPSEESLNDNYLTLYNYFKKFPPTPREQKFLRAVLYGEEMDIKEYHAALCAIRRKVSKYAKED